jgi:cysteine synthase
MILCNNVNNSGEVQNKYTITEGTAGNVCVGESDRRLKETA